MTNYQLSVKNGVVKVETPISELLAVRKALASVYREEVVKEVKQEAENGSNAYGIISRVAKKFGTSPTGVKKLLNNNNVVIRASLDFQSANN